MRRVHPMGDKALLIECHPEEVLGLAATITETARTGTLAGVVDVIPGARTVLVTFADDRRTSAELLTRLEPHAQAATTGALVSIDVVYDGPDLDRVADSCGLTVEDVVARHESALYTVAFCGFAPGFPYLVGGDPLLRAPRLPTPRPRVLAGSVAIAAEYSGIYPSPSPGGWNIIGHTDAELFVDYRDPPALLIPGHRVRFRRVGELSEPARALSSTAVTEDVAIEVIASGPQALVQDLGRPGHGSIAIGTSGAFDRVAHRLANRLLGNSESAATIECLGGGLRIRAVAACLVAVTGAMGDLDIDGRPADRGAPLHLGSGQTLSLLAPASGLRSYVGIRGGFRAFPALGSLSYDTLGHLGPRPLAPGDVLAAGQPGGLPAVDHVPVAPSPDLLTARISRGPRWDWFTPDTQFALTNGTFVVTDRSDRIGVRLSGAPLLRAPDAPSELPSEGMVRGGIQVPPDGDPVVLGPDHPVTGGYPVIAVVADADVDRFAQARPGTHVQFVGSG